MINIRVRHCLVTSIGFGSILCAASADAATCTVDTSGISFGSYNPLQSSDTESTGTVQLNCDSMVAASVALTAGRGTYDARMMSNGISGLQYNIYADPARTTVWGDGTQGSQPVSISAQSANIPVYGTVPAQQNVTAGLYTDNITVTVTF